MATTFITPVDITPATSNSWVDADVSAHVSAAATGVMFSVHNNVANSRKYGARNNGSTDADVGDPAGGVAYGHVGIDASGIFELFVENITNATVELLGYYEDEAVFFTNASTPSGLGKDTWTDWDISALSGVDTSIAAIVRFDSSCFCRENGSTDERILGASRAASTAIVGVDASEIFEIRRDTNSEEIGLIGYLTSGYVSEGVNATDVTPATVAAWIDLTALGSTDAIGAIYEGYPNAKTGVVKKGITPGSEHIGPAYSHLWMVAECDSLQIVQGYAETGGELYLHGYFEAASSNVSLVGSVGFGIDVSSGIKKSTYLQAQVSLDQQILADLKTTNKVSGNVSFEGTISSGITSTTRLVGSTSLSVGVLADTKGTIYRAGSVGFSTSPAALFGGAKSILGEVPLAVDILADFKSVSYRAGSVGFSISPAALLEYLSSIDGEVPLAVSVASTFKSTIYRIGSVDFSTSPNAQFGEAKAITGNVSFESSPLADFKLDRLVSGEVSLAIDVLANTKSTIYKAGSVDFSTSPAASFGASKSILGEVSLAVGVLADFKKDSSIVGSVGFQTSANANFGASKLLIGSISLSTQVSSGLKGTYKNIGSVALGLAVCSLLKSSSNLSGDLDFAFGTASKLDISFAGHTAFSLNISRAPNAVNSLSVMNIPIVVGQAGPIIFYTEETIRLPIARL